MNDPIPNIDYSWRSTYLQGLLLVQSFDIDPGTPNIAAIFSLLFNEHGLSDCRRNLKDWLYDYISPFVLSPIRNEQNLKEKTLAIAVFIFLSKGNQLNEKTLPSEQLIDYIEYAEKQAWLDDSFLAFYCYFLRDQLISCENVGDYFKSNYELFLQKKHVSAISQSLIVLKSQLSSIDSQRGFNVLVDLLNKKELTNKNLPWVLWALSTNPELNTSVIQQLTSLLDDELFKLLRYLQKESGFANIVSSILVGASDYHVESYIENLNKKTSNKIEMLQYNEGRKLSVEFKSKTETSFFSLNELSLALLSMHGAQYDKVAYVQDIQKDKISILKDSLKSLFQGSIVLSKPEKIILNSLVILFTIQLGLLVLFFQTGLPAKYSEIKLSWETFVILIAWLDYLWAQMQASFWGNSALDGVKKFPLIRHLFSLFSKP